MKMYKLLCVMLCFSIIFSTSMSALAVNSTTDFTVDPGTTENGYSDIDGRKTRTWFECVGGGKYYTEITDEYTLSVGIVNNVVDCSIKYTDEPNRVYSNTFMVSSNRQDINDIDSQLLNYRHALLAGGLELKSSVFRESTDNMRGDGDLIMSELYSAGWPHSYTNWERETRYQNGATAKLYHSVSYSYTPYVNWFAVASTTLSALITLTNLPAETLLAIVSVSLTAAGVYVLIKDVTITRYNVFAYGGKSVYVQDTYQYYAGRTVKWLATVGDIGCALDFCYNNQHSDYDDHDSLFTSAFYYYFNP